MPNFWTKSIQKLDEKRKGPRTKDEEFFEKVKEANVIEKAMTKLRYICGNFVGNFEKIMEYNRNLTECIFLIYNKNEQFKEFSESLTKIHTQNNTIFQSILDDVMNISNTTEGWPCYFKEIKNLVEEREDARRNYDHYEKKLHRMEDKYIERRIKGCLVRHHKFAEAIDRNETKYLISKQNYLTKANEAYNKIDFLLDNRFNIVNPVLLKLFAMETKVYDSFHSQYASYKNLEAELKKMKKVYESYEEEKKGKYDPRRYMKYGNLDLIFEKIKCKNITNYYAFLEPPQKIPERVSSHQQRKPSLYTLEEFNKIKNIFSANDEGGNEENQSIDQSDRNYMKDENKDENKEEIKIDHKIDFKNNNKVDISKISKINNKSNIGNISKFINNLNYNDNYNQIIRLDDNSYSLNKSTITNAINFNQTIII